MTTANPRNAFEEQPNEIFELILTFLEYKDAARFRMTSAGYYNGLRMTLTEEHRNTVEFNWREICSCGGVNHVGHGVSRFKLQHTAVPADPSMVILYFNVIHGPIADHENVVFVW
mmetsp:Transcript_24385/g.29483  ORF Transcript_24385/g.29483 Transcript_24385/m.29483 type:complete len:115 (+) Transcript_24385:524-868(+)